MWTDAHRARYRRDSERFPSDLTDAEWVRLEPLIPDARPGGRPRKTDMREAMNAILYLLRTGCPWRYLPRDGFPPRSTVYNIFRNFQRRGDLGSDLGRVARGRCAKPDGPRGQPDRPRLLDSQSIKSAEKGAVRDDQVGYDAGKKVKGRKIHALVDTEGLPMRVIVHSAAIQDRDGAGLVLDKIRRRFPWLELIWADGGYNAHGRLTPRWQRCPCCAWRSSSGATTCKGFVVLPRRWVVERTFSWFGRNRRLAKDFENLAETLGRLRYHRQHPTRGQATRKDVGF